MTIYSHQMMGYDRALTTFSPDGRLLQVEYAKEAVKIGTAGFAIKFKKGVILVGEKRKVNKLIVESSLEKIYEIEEDIYAIPAGIASDGRILIERARLISKQHKMIFGSKIDILLLVKEICDLKQLYTQYGGARPYGVSIIFAGKDNDNKYRIFTTEPLGNYFEYEAVAVGSNMEEKLNKYLGENYKAEMNKEEALKLSYELIKILKKEENTIYDILVLEDDKKEFLKLEDLKEMFEKEKNKKTKKKKENK